MNATRVLVTACVVLVALAAAPAAFAQAVPDVPSGGIVAPAPVSDGGTAAPAPAPTLAPAAGWLHDGVAPALVDALARWWAARTMAPARAPAARIGAAHRPSFRAGNRVLQGVR